MAIVLEFSIKCTNPLTCGKSYTVKVDYATNISNNVFCPSCGGIAEVTSQYVPFEIKPTGEHEDVT